MKKLTKTDIEQLAKEIRRWANRCKLGKDWVLFYNGKMMHSPLGDDYRYKRSRVEKDVNPLDYCEWFNDEFIMGMSYDGIMYRCINGYEKGSAYAYLEAILHNYGLQIAHCDSCHCEFVNYDNDEVETTKLKRKRVIRLISPGKAKIEHCWDDNVEVYPSELNEVMITWRSESEKVGDIGGCVLGDYLQFDYKGDTYRMDNQSPYQGEYSWTKPLPKIKKMLADMGATNIFHYPGRLD